MTRSDGRNERMVALFLLGAVLFSPLMLRVFDAGPTATLAGVPALFLYLFAAWGLLIALSAVVVGTERPGAEVRPPEGGDGTS
jgi:hypothetical protein